MLGSVIVSEPEAYNEVDERLFTLWVRTAHHMARFPMPQPDDLEYGFDRMGTYLDKLVGAGMDSVAARSMMLNRWAETVRTWPSTGVWVWEQLVSDAPALCKRVLAFEDGAKRLAHVLSAVLELPKSALELGALDVLRKVGAQAPLVPDQTMERLLKDAEYRSLLGPLKRTGASAPFKEFVGGTTTAVPLIELR